MAVSQREVEIERYMTQKIKRMGGECLKWQAAMGTAGVPDRIIFLGGEVFFVEVKRPDGHVRPIQRAMHKRLKKQGFDVYTVRNKLEVDDLLAEIAVTP